MDTARDRTTEKVDIIQTLLEQNQHVFSKNDTDLGLTYLAEHVIYTNNATPVKQHHDQYYWFLLMKTKRLCKSYY